MPNPVHFVHVGPLAQARRGGGRERPLTAKAPVRQTSHLGPLPLLCNDVAPVTLPLLSLARHPQGWPTAPQWYHQGGEGGAVLCGSLSELFRCGLKVLECLEFV